MGIKGLMKLLSDEASGCIKEVPLSFLSGRIIAIDASMVLYQFLIAIRTSGYNPGMSGAAQNLTNEAGESTSHIQGLFNRTIRFLENGIRPVYVFDGKPPEMKSNELLARTEKRTKAEEELSKLENDNVESINRYTKRLVRVTEKHNQDVKELLQLMGMPIVNAPCEAEATCAELNKKGLVYGVGTEDMDALTFGSKILLRHLTFSSGGGNSKGKKSMILEIHLEKALDGLKVTYDEFIDLCILCGCDYTESIRGIGPKKALNLIKKYHTIENIIVELQKKQSKGVVIPKRWLSEASKDGSVEMDTSQEETSSKESESENEKEKESDDERVEEEEEKLEKEDNEGKEEDAEEMKVTEEELKAKETGEKTPPTLNEIREEFKTARRMFSHPDVIYTNDVSLKWKDIQENELRDFLVTKHGFNLERVNNAMVKLKKAKGTQRQQKLDSFFQIQPKPNAEKKGSMSSNDKRKGTKEFATKNKIAKKF